MGFHSTGTGYWRTGCGPRTASDDPLPGPTSASWTTAAEVTNADNLQKRCRLSSLSKNLSQSILPLSPTTRNRKF